MKQSYKDYLKLFEKTTEEPWELAEEDDGLIIKMATALSPQDGGREPQHEVVCDTFALEEDQLKEAENNMEFCVKSHIIGPEAVRLLKRAEEILRKIPVAKIPAEQTVEIVDFLAELNKKEEEVTNEITR